jgi:hypothetical protein
MPFVGHNVLANYRFGVGTQQVPDVDPADGQQRFDAKGEPKMREETLLVFADPAGGHEVHVPLTDEARRELARQLNGGIIVAAGAPS